MPERIDHVIAAHRDFSRLVTAFSRLGFHIVGGGIHPHLGTRNRIIVLGETYIELLGIDSEAIASSTLKKRLADTTSGWVGFAVQSADIIADARHLENTGATFTGPTRGSLVSPTGMTRSWRTVQIIQGAPDDFWAHAEPLPFLIQHDSTGERHQRELAGADSLAAHPNGAIAVQDVVIAVHDLSSASAPFAEMLGLTVTRSRHGTDSDADHLTLTLSAGQQTITLATAEYSGLARERLESAGEGLCLVRIGVADMGKTRRFFYDHGIGYSVASERIHVDRKDSAGVALEIAGR